MDSLHKKFDSFVLEFQDLTNTFVQFNNTKGGDNLTRIEQLENTLND